VDTGASGLFVNKALAEHVGLKPSAEAKFTGIGDAGAQSGYVAYADSIRIGSLEFRNCLVEVSDKKDVVGLDGLIGSDVFKDYLVTLDYAMRKMTLAQLPPLPNESSESTGSLSTDSGESSWQSEPQDRYVSPTMKDYFPVLRRFHYLIIPAMLNGKAQKLFVIDTGAFATSISPEAAREVTKVHREGQLRVRGISGEVSKVQTSDSIMFQFADFRQLNTNIVTFDMSHLSESAGMEISGFLGNSLLRELTIHIDYRDGLIKFDYDPKYGNHNYEIP
jgi:predicted aspartyl protease